MKILIIEDDELKHQHLEKFVSNLIADSDFTWRKSYQSGLKEIMANTYRFSFARYEYAYL